MKVEKLIDRLAAVSPSLAAKLKEHALAIWATN